MKKDKKNELSGELNYWQPISDVMSALLLSLLLVIMLLILYVVRTPDEELVDPWRGDEEYEYVQEDDDAWSYERDDDYDGRYWEENHWNDSNGGNGGYGGGDGDGDQKNEEDFDATEEFYEYTEEGLGDYYGTEKAAVYVSVIDAETGRTIKEPGILFELFNAKEERQALNAYYPQKVSFQQFETMESGVFYLPEKIWLGWYSLREISEPYGYDAAENMEFTIDESHDWDEPYMLYVPLFPSRSVIRLRTQDMNTGEPVQGGVYEIIAATDIVTADGTLRYHEGEVVDTLNADADGNAESCELYLGEYLIVQREAPKYYASLGQTYGAAAEKRSIAGEPGVHALDCERTTFSLTLTDALYAQRGLADVEFMVTRDGASEALRYATDERGRLVLNELEKDTVYHLRQMSTPKGYRYDDEEIAFAVDAEGRIEKQAKAEKTLTNRTTRLSVSVRDVLLRSMVSDHNVALYDAQGTLVKTWNCSGMAEMTEGLEPGSYRIVIGGAGGTEKEIQIKDEEKIQTVDCGIWTNSSIAGAAGVGAVAAGGIAVVVLAARKKRRHRE